LKSNMGEKRKEKKSKALAIIAKQNTSQSQSQEMVTRRDKLNKQMTNRTYGIFRAKFFDGWGRVVGGGGGSGSLLGGGSCSLRRH